MSAATALCRQPHRIDSSISSTMPTAALCRHQQHCPDCVDSSSTVSAATSLFRQRQHCIDSSISSTVSTAAALSRHQKHCVDSNSAVSTAPTLSHRLFKKTTGSFAFFAQCFPSEPSQTPARRVEFKHWLTALCDASGLLVIEVKTSENMLCKMKFPGITAAQCGSSCNTRLH